MGNVCSSNRNADRPSERGGTTPPILCLEDAPASSSDNKQHANVDVQAEDSNPGDAAGQCNRAPSPQDLHHSNPARASPTSVRAVVDARSTRVPEFAKNRPHLYAQKSAFQRRSAGELQGVAALLARRLPAVVEPEAAPYDISELEQLPRAHGIMRELDDNKNDDATLTTLAELDSIRVFDSPEGKDATDQDVDPPISESPARPPMTPEAGAIGVADVVLLSAEECGTPSDVPDGHAMQVDPVDPSAQVAECSEPSEPLEPLAAESGHSAASDVQHSAVLQPEAAMVAVDGNPGTAQESEGSRFGRVGTPPVRPTNADPTPDVSSHAHSAAQEETSMPSADCSNDADGNPVVLAATCEAPLPSPVASRAEHSLPDTPRLGESQPATSSPEAPEEIETNPELGPSQNATAAEPARPDSLADVAELAAADSDADAVEPPSAAPANTRNENPSGVGEQSSSSPKPNAADAVVPLTSTEFLDEGAAVGLGETSSPSATSRKMAPLLIPVDDMQAGVKAAKPPGSPGSKGAFKPVAGWAPPGPVTAALE